MQISLSVIIPAVFVSAGFFAFAVTKAIKARLTKPTTGTEDWWAKWGRFPRPFHPRERFWFMASFGMPSVMNPLREERKFKS